MTDYLYVTYIKGYENMPDVLSVYRDDEKFEHVNTISGDKVQELLSMLDPELRIPTIMLSLRYSIAYVDFGNFNYSLIVHRMGDGFDKLTKEYNKCEALHLYRKLTGAPDNIRDMWPETIFAVPPRHCGYSAAMMMIDELHERKAYFKKSDIPKMYVKHEPKFTLENCLNNEVRHYIEEDVKATTELFNNIYYGRTVSFGTLPKIEKVLFNAPATIVFWKDGTKTVVKAQGDDEFDPEKGLAMAISRKALGNQYEYYEVFLKHVGRYEKQQRKEQEMLEKLGICADEGYLDRLADGMKRFAEAAKQVAPHMPGDRHDS